MRPFASATREVYEDPEYYPFADLVADQYKNTVFGAVKQYVSRQRAATGVSFEPDKPGAFAFLGEMDDEETFRMLDAQYDDQGEARAALMQMRAAKTRMQRIQSAGTVSQLVSSMLAYSPQAVLEYGLFRGTLSGMRFMRMPVGLKTTIGADIGTAGLGEASAEALRVALDPVDGIEEAIANGTAGFLMAAGLIGGIEGLRARPWSRTAESFRRTQQPERVAAAHAAVDEGRPFNDTGVSQQEFDEVLAPAYGLSTGSDSLREFLAGRTDDGLRGQKFVNPRQETRSWGEQLWIVPRATARKMGIKRLKPGSTRVLLKRAGHSGTWELAGQGKRLSDVEDIVMENFPMRREVDNFADPQAHGWMQARRADVFGEFKDVSMGRTRRANFIQVAAQREVEFLRQRYEGLKKQIAKLTDEGEKAEARKLLTPARERMEQAQRDYDLFLKSRNPRHAVFEGPLADALVKTFARTRQLPFWNMVGNTRVRDTPVGELWQWAAERLAGTNGAMLPDPERPAVRSIMGDLRSHHVGRYEGLDQIVRDAYALRHNLGKGISPSTLKRQQTKLNWQRRWSKLKGTQQDPAVQTFAQFEKDLNDAAHNWVENGIKPDDPHLAKALDGIMAYLEKYGGELKSAGIFPGMEQARKALEDVEAAAAANRPLLAKEREIRDRIEDIAAREGPTTPEQQQALLERDVVRELAQAVGLQDRLHYLPWEEVEEITKGGAPMAIKRSTRALHVIDENGVSYVSVRPSEAGEAQRMHSVLHETSHAIDYHFWNNATRETKEAVVEDFQRYLGSARDPNLTIDQLFELLRGPEELTPRPEGADKPLTEAQRKWAQKFTEYKADRIAYWLKTNKEPRTLVEKYFSKLANLWREVTRIMGLPQDNIDKFMREVWNQEIPPVSPSDIARQGVEHVKTRAGRQFQQAPSKRPEEVLLERYKELATQQQQAREAGTDWAYKPQDQWPEDYVERGIEMAQIREKLDELSWDQFQRQQSQRLSQDERTNLRRIQDQFNDLALQIEGEGIRGLEAEEVNAKFMAMAPLFNKMSTDVLTAWRNSKDAKLGDKGLPPYIKEMIGFERDVLDNVISRRKQGAKAGGLDSLPEKTIERIWSSTRHLEVPLPSREAKRLNARKVRLSERLEDIRTNLPGKHMPRRWDSDRIDADYKLFKAGLTKYYEENPKPGATGTPEERADATIRQIHGENTYNDPAGVMEFTEGGAPLRPGDLARRRLDMDSTWSTTVEVDGETRTFNALDFIDPNVTDVLRSYTNRIAGALEMQRAFGTMSGERYVQELARKSLDAGLDQETVDEMVGSFRDLRDQILGLDSIGNNDPTKWYNRALRSARYLNILAFMGRVPEMMLVDTGMMVHQAGFRNLLSAMSIQWQSQATDLGKTVRKDSADLFGAASEITQMSRAGVFTNDTIGRIDKMHPAERWLQSTAQDFFFWTGASWFTDVQRSMTGILIGHELVRLSGKVVDGTIANQDMAKLRQLGLDRDQARQLYAQWLAIPASERTYRSNLSGAQLNMMQASRWEDTELAAQIGSAVRNEMDHNVFTVNAATRPKILREEWAKGLLLYQTFGIHTTQSLQMRLAQRGVRDMSGAAASMIALAFLVSAIRAPDYVERDPEDAIFEAIQMSGILGFQGDILSKIGDSTALDLGGYIGLDPKPWAEGNDLSRLNPIASQWWQLGNALFNPDMAGDDRARAMKYMVPYNNHWIWSHTWDAPNKLRDVVGGALPQ